MRNRPRHAWAPDEGPVGLPGELLFLLMTAAGGIASLWGVFTFGRWLVRLALG